MTGYEPTLRTSFIIYSITSLCCFFNDIIYKFIAILIKVSLFVQQLITIASPREASSQQRLLLQAQWAILLTQRDSIDRQLAELDLSLTPQQQNQIISSPLHGHSPITDSSLSTRRFSSRTTPATQRRQRSRPNSNSYSFAPHPIPFTPPRTPDEVRRNNIVIWLNEIRARQHQENSNP